MKKGKEMRLLFSRLLQRDPVALTVKVCRTDNRWEYIVQYSHNHRVVWRSAVEFRDHSEAKTAAKNHVKALKKLGVRAAIKYIPRAGRQVAKRKVISFA